MRAFWVWLHRWLGLAMAGFLILVALTGSAITFYGELDEWLNRDLTRVVVRNVPMLDGFMLREKAQATDPRIWVDAVSLEKIEPGASVSFSVTARTDPATEKPYELPYEDIYLDPYTGEKIGERSQAGSLSRRNIMLFLFELHRKLALPGEWSNWGVTILGVVALAWTIDCFVSFYLTFPLRMTKDASQRKALQRKTWLARWMPAWLIKWRGGVYRVNFDIHRAFGLWTWAMLFIFAWSSVAFNLGEVYGPVMNTLFWVTPEPAEAPTPTPAARPRAADTPTLDWHAAHARGRALLEDAAQRYALHLGAEQSLILNREENLYQFISLATSKGDDLAPLIKFDADSGALIEEVGIKPDPRFQGVEPTVTITLMQLHMAGIGGFPMKVFVCAMGFVITALSVTGVYIWWKKRLARVRRATQKAIDVAQEAAPS